MNNKQLYILTSILVLGLSLIFVRQYLTKKISNKPNEYIKTVEKIDQNLISKIEIKDSSNVLTLKKDTDNWYIASKSADSAMVEDVFNAVFIKNSPVLIAESERQKEKLGLADDQATIINFNSDKDNLLSLAVGQDIGRNTVVKFIDNNKIYSLKNFPQIDANPDSWYDLKIVDIDSMDVKKLSWNQFAIESDNNNWKFVDSDQSINEDAVRNFLMSLNPLKAKDLAFDLKINEYNTSYPTFELSILDRNDKDILLSFYRGINDYLVKRSDGEYFVISISKGDDLNKQMIDFVLNN